jgi:hypothetical protein
VMLRCCHCYRCITLPAWLLVQMNWVLPFMVHGCDACFSCRWLLCVLWLSRCISHCKPLLLRAFVLRCSGYQKDPVGAAS